MTERVSASATPVAVDEGARFEYPEAAELRWTINQLHLEACVRSGAVELFFLVTPDGVIELTRPPPDLAVARCVREKIRRARITPYPGSAFTARKRVVARTIDGGSDE